MIKRLIVIPFFFLLNGYTTALAQDPIAALNKLAVQHPSERIYIHYDRDYYSAGETIWFKAYLYSSGMPSTISNNFYLQLVNRDGEIIAERKYPVKGATVNGNIFLPDSLPQGYYHVRALTPVMLNNSPEFLYRKNIFVFGQKPDGNAAQPASGPLSLQFFPENGRMVGDVQATLVFRATDSVGNPVDVSGNIKTEDGTMITSYKTVKGGFGKVLFKPQPGKKYIASAEWNGQTTYHPLPEAESAGINLKIEDEPGGKIFLLSRTKKNKDSYEKLKLVAHMNNLVVFEQEIRFESYFSVKGHLLTDSLPSGIIHFTVFDKENLPLAERLSFVNNYEYESGGTINVVKRGTGAREENIIEISFPNPAQRSMSISVTDAEAGTAIPADNIVSTLLVQADLEGFPASRQYISREADSATAQEFDRLLLTQHWKRFAWKDILEGKFPEGKANDPYLLSFSGQLKDSKTKAAVQGGDLILFVDSEDSLKQEFQITVSNTGEFRIDSLLIFGTTEIQYAYKTPEGKERTTNMMILPSQNSGIITKIPFALTKEERLALYRDSLVLAGAGIVNTHLRTSKLSEQKELAPVILQSESNQRPIEIVNEKYTKGAFTAMGKINLDLINEPENNRSLSVYDYVKRSIRQLSEQKGEFVNIKFHSLFNSSTNEWDSKNQKTLDSTASAAGGTPPGSSRFVDQGIRERGDYNKIAVYVNENQTDISQLKSIRMDNIALIKFYDPGFLGSGMNGPGGTLAIYTKNEVPLVKSMDKLDHVTVDGFSLPGRFITPDLNQPRVADEPADTRRTLLWNPDLITDEKTKTIQVRFYNNDVTRKFRINVEGFDAKGKLISLEKIINENE